MRLRGSFRRLAGGLGATIAMVAVVGVVLAPVAAHASTQVLLSESFDGEHGGTGQLNYFGWSDWAVTAGCVDLMGRGFYYDYGDHGLVAELDGSCLGTTPTSVFQTRNSFTLLPGTQYQLQFDLAGNGNSHPADPVEVSLGTAYAETFSIETDWPNAFQSITRTITTGVPITAPLVFEVPDTSDFQGPFLDNVSLTAIGDGTPPVVTGTPDRGPDHDGWYTSPVTIHWTAMDPAPSSGQPSQPADTLAALEGEDVVYTSGPSCDPAGNCASGSLALSIDLTDPEVTCGPTPTFTLGQADATVSATVADAVSGPQAGSLAQAVGTSAPGPHSVQLTGADMAGRTATASCPYRVAYGFGGFLPPIGNPPAINAVKAGRSIPVQWTLTAADGSPVSDPASFVRMVSGPGCDPSGPADTVESAAGSSGLQYLGAGIWQFNWKTPKSYAGQCRTLHLSLADGVDRTAMFRFA